MTADKYTAAHYAAQRLARKAAEEIKRDNSDPDVEMPSPGMAYQFWLDSEDAPDVSGLLGWERREVRRQFFIAWAATTVPAYDGNGGLLT